MARIEGSIARTDRAIAHQVDIIESNDPIGVGVDLARARLKTLHSMQTGYFAYRNWVLDYWERA